MRVHDPAAREARETDVRERGERDPGAGHAPERSQRHRRPGAVIRADRRHVEPRQSAGDGLGPDPARYLGVVVECQEGDDRERRDAADRPDRDHELLEVEERLHHEQVDPPPLQHLCLRRVQRAVLGCVEDLELTQRPDRPRDEDVPAGNLPRLAGEPDARRVDLLEVAVEEHARELAPVRAEGVRLDELRPRGDVARVHRDDALRRAKVRLLGATQPVDRLGDQRAGPSVGDDRRAAAQALEKPAHAFDCSPGRRPGIGRSGAAAGPRSDTNDPEAMGAVPPRA